MDRQDILDQINPDSGELKVAAMGGCSDPDVITMGTLVDLGYMTKEYVSTGIVDCHEIHWTLHKDAPFTVSLGGAFDGIEMRSIKPGETDVWEK